ncbi:MAG: tRNA preQ1(34) S-adenosylmethionine ribosyltransferase-isomerase QueA [Eggerthellaceae bacterium]|nr:tRNA preQ1(34) S-adenosylmethionine ribosyltransferase-isomerase QueA [Eggerthellaceae bacterium]
MLTSDFDYQLPEELIAQTPHIPRDECRLLVLDRKTGSISDRIFRDVLEYLRPGDLLVANETRVLPARLLGRKRGTGGRAEVFLLREGQGPEPRSNRVAFWEALVRPGKRLKPGSGSVVDFEAPDGSIAMSAEVIDWAPGAQKGERLVRLSTELLSLDEALHLAGKTPLPPYIKDYAGDQELYQTVYSKRESSAAAPTAGLHFTPELIDQARAMGVGWQTVELEVGLDTFRIVDEERAEDHAMHTERYSVSEECVQAINETKANGGRVIAVGTTSVRSLESACRDEQGKFCGLEPRERAKTSLFLLPGSEFHVVDGLITNFHVPRSTLMMLVSAFASREQIMQAYQHAISERYRMLSFGDAMLIL